MRHIVIGAGAIGGALGGRLTQAGRDTVLVARGDGLTALRTSGIRLRGHADDVTVPVTTAAGPGDIRLTTDDVLLLTVKTHQAAVALAEWADTAVHDAEGQVVGTAGDLLPVFLLLNGVSAEELALRWFARVYGVCVWVPAVHVTPGEVFLRGDPVPGSLRISRVPATLTTDADRELVRRVADDWEAAGFQTTPVDDVMPWKYRKLINNVGNAAAALFGLDRSAPYAEAARREVREVYAAAGMVCTSDAEEAAARGQAFSARSVAGEPDGAGGSTWQSLRRGTGDAESDFLNGEIVRLAHQLGRSAPVNATLARLMRQAVRTGAAPGDLDPTSVPELRSF